MPFSCCFSTTPACGLAALSGVNCTHPGGVSAIKSVLTEIRREFEVARRLAIFAVKKLRRFEREETRAVRSSANGVSGASFSRFSEKRPILGKNRAAAKRISFRLFSLGASKENGQT